MPGHYAYLIGVDGHIAKRVGIVCGDDEEAKDLAKQMADGHAVELWHGACMIAAFEPAAFEPEK